MHELPARTSRRSVGQRQLALTQYGRRPSLLVLESGAGDNQHVWRPLLPALLPLSSICTYDRAGLGQSDPAPHPRTLQSLVDDLAQVLAALPSIPRPILMGHSLGGLIVFRYAQCYPQHVGGLIVLDALPPCYGAALVDLLTRYASQSAIVANLLTAITTSTAADHPEGLDIHSADAILDHAPPLLGFPMHVISRGRSVQDDLPDMPPALVADLDTAWRALQGQYVQQSSTSRWTIAETSGHAIPTDAPHLIVDAVRAMLTDGTSR